MRKLTTAQRNERIAEMKDKLSALRERKRAFGYRTREEYNDGSAIVTQYGPGPESEILGVWTLAPGEDACLLHFATPEVKQINTLASAAGLSPEAFIRGLLQDKLKQAS